MESPAICKPDPQAIRAPRVYNDNDPAEHGTATAIVTDGSQEYVLSAGHVVGRTLRVAGGATGETVSDGDGSVVGDVSLVPAPAATGLDAALITATGDRRANLPRPNRVPVTVTRRAEDLLEGPGADYRVLAYRAFRAAALLSVIPDFSVNGVYADGDVVFLALLELDVATEGGDSGALVVDNQGRAVGLHILGVSDTAGDRGYAIPIDDVLEYLFPNRALQILF